MQDKTNQQNQGNKTQNQDQLFPEQKKRTPAEKTIKDLSDNGDDDGDEDENHYDDSVEKN